MSVPVSLAETNSKLKTGQKALLADVIVEGVECPSTIELHGSSCLLIDGMTLIVALVANLLMPRPFVIMKKVSKTQS